ncbi:AMP-binding protein [Xanthomonas albilineans]|uniref:AMP-binding protein n=1 Tax=Xanthomonas albilineans TaxID=29447 RepID=UPI001304E7E3|nr:AMP-binding protein [Xanthomonas albilineans]
MHSGTELDLRWSVGQTRPGRNEAYARQWTTLLHQWRRDYPGLRIDVSDTPIGQHITIDYAAPYPCGSFGSLLREYARLGKLAGLICDYLKHRHQIVLSESSPGANTLALDLGRIEEPKQLDRLQGALGMALEALATRRSDGLLLWHADHRQRNLPDLRDSAVCGSAAQIPLPALSCVEDLIEVDTSLLACDHGKLCQIASHLPASWFARSTDGPMPASWFARSTDGPMPSWSDASTAVFACAPIGFLPSVQVNVCAQIFSAAHLASTAQMIDPLRQQAFSYRQLRSRAATYARHLSLLGLQSGDAVALIAIDSLAGVALMLACLAGGLVFAPINELVSLAHFETTIKTIKPRLVLIDAELPPSHHAALRHLPTLELTSLMPVIENDELVVAPCPADTPAVMICTSGSTGTPKAVTHSHADFMHCHLNYQQAVLGLRSDDVMYTPSRVFFAYGLNNLMLSLLAGVSHVIAAPLSVRQIAQTIHTYHVTVLLAVPAVFKLLLAEAAPDAVWPALRLCISAGESLPARLGHAISTRWQVEVLDGIGCTEVLSTFISNRPGHALMGCTGTPVPGFVVKLVNKQGEICRIGEVGSLWVRGNTLTRGYVGDPILSAQLFVDGWFDTRDLFFADAKGRFHNLGRMGSAIKINGCWLSPETLESVIQTHACVKECAICLIEDEFGLPRPAAFVVPVDASIDTGALWAALRALCKNALGKHHYPHLFVEVSTIPRTCSGKVIRPALLETLASAKHLQSHLFFVGHART